MHLITYNVYIYIIIYEKYIDLYTMWCIYQPPANAAGLCWAWDCNYIQCDVFWICSLSRDASSKKSLIGRGCCSPSCGREWSYLGRKLLEDQQWTSQAHLVAYLLATFLDSRVCRVEEVVAAVCFTAKLTCLVLAQLQKIRANMDE